MLVAVYRLLVVSCSASNVDPVDNDGDSRNSDAVVVNDAFGAKDAQDAVDSGDLHADISEVALDADGVAGDGCGYADCAAMDIPTDAIVCGDVPQEGCPCDPINDKPCCLEIAKGMSCGWLTFAMGECNSPLHGHGTGKDARQAVGDQETFGGGVDAVFADDDQLLAGKALQQAVQPIGQQVFAGELSFAPTSRRVTH